MARWSVTTWSKKFWRRGLTPPRYSLRSMTANRRSPKSPSRRAAEESRTSISPAKSTSRFTVNCWSINDARPGVQSGLLFVRSHLDGLDVFLRAQFQLQMGHSTLRVLRCRRVRKQIHDPLEGPARRGKIPGVPHTQIGKQIEP